MDSPEYTYLKDLKPCIIPDASSCFYGTCASCCVIGLMIQKADTKSLGKNDAGICKPCYVESCYPCVFTQSCCTYASCLVCISLIPDENVQNFLSAFFQIGTNFSIRRQLMTEANVKPPSRGVTCLHACFPCIFCTSCNDAAYVMAKRKTETMAKVSVSQLVF